MEQTDFMSARKTRTAHLSQLTKIYNEIEKQMVSYENTEKVKELYDRLCNRYELFKTVHLQCMDLCKDAETVETLGNSYVSQQNNFVECKKHYTEWIKCLDSAADDDNTSVCTRASPVQSSRAAMQNAKAKRLVAEHRLKTLSEKQRLEWQLKEIENKIELLKQESEVEIARIEERKEEILVCARITEQTHQENEPDIDVSTSGNRHVPRDTSASAESHVFLQSRFDGDGSSEGSYSEFEKLATIVQEGPELITSNGSAIDYCNLNKNFETNVELKMDAKTIPEDISNALQEIFKDDADSCERVLNILLSKCNSNEGEDPFMLLQSALPDLMEVAEMMVCDTKTPEKNELTDHPDDGQRPAFDIPKEEIHVVVRCCFRRAVSRLSPESLKELVATVSAMDKRVSWYGIRAISLARQDKPFMQAVLVLPFLAITVITKIKQWKKGEITGVQCVKDILDSCVSLAAGIGGGITGEIIGASLGSYFGTRGKAVGAVTGAAAVGALASSIASSLCYWLPKWIFGQPKSKA